jgi:hypothetical protein
MVLIHLEKSKNAEPAMHDFSKSIKYSEKCPK